MQPLCLFRDRLFVCAFVCMCRDRDKESKGLDGRARMYVVCESVCMCMCVLCLCVREYARVPYFGQTSEIIFCRIISEETIIR